MEKDKEAYGSFLMGDTDWGGNGLVLMGRAMINKSLIQFSVDGWGCVPSLLFTWGQTMVEVMKIMMASFRRSHACTATLIAPNPCLCQRLLDTHGQVRVSLLWGQCSFLLGPGVYKVLFLPSKSVFSQSCVSSGSSMVGLMVTYSKRAYAIPKSAAPKAPVPEAGHCWLILHRRHSNTVLYQSLWALWVLVCTGFVWALWASTIKILLKFLW